MWYVYGDAVKKHIHHITSSETKHYRLYLPAICTIALKSVCVCVLWAICPEMYPDNICI